MNEKKIIRHTRDGMQRVNLVTGKKEQLTHTGEHRFSPTSQRRFGEKKPATSGIYGTAAKASAIRRQRSGSGVQGSEKTGAALRFKLAGNSKFRLEKGKGALARPVKSAVLLQHGWKIRSEKEKLRAKYGLAAKKKEKFKSDTQKKNLAADRKDTDRKKKYAAARFSVDGKSRVYHVRAARFRRENAAASVVRGTRFRGTQSSDRLAIPSALSRFRSSSAGLIPLRSSARFQGGTSGGKTRFSSPMSKKGLVLQYLLRKGSSAAGRAGKDDEDKEDNFALSALAGGKRSLSAVERNLRLYQKYRGRASVQAANRAVLRRAAIRRAVMQKATQKAVEHGIKSVIKAAASKAVALLFPKIAIAVVIAFVVAFVILYIASLVQMIASIGSTAATLHNPPLESYVEELDEGFRDEIQQVRNDTGGDDDVVRTVGLDKTDTDPYALALISLGSWENVDVNDDTKLALESVHDAIYGYTVTHQQKTEEIDEGNGWHTNHYTEYTIRINVMAPEDYISANYPPDTAAVLLDNLEVLREIEAEVGDLEIDVPTEIIPSEGEFAWPVPGHTTLSSYWGDGRNHKGIDIADAGINGQPVVAMADGKVTRAIDGYGVGYPGSPDGGGYGNHVYLEHGNGLTSRYGHMSRVVVSVGDTVKKGQIIGYVGSSGDSSGPHLHFEIRENGTPKDPMLWYQDDA